MLQGVDMQLDEEITNQRVDCSLSYSLFVMKPASFAEASRLRHNLLELA
jgi:hypothetical protein